MKSSFGKKRQNKQNGWRWFIYCRAWNKKGFKVSLLWAHSNCGCNGLKIIKGALILASWFVCRVYVVMRLRPLFHVFVRQKQLQVTAFPLTGTSIILIMGIIPFYVITLCWHFCNYYSRSNVITVLRKHIMPILKSSHISASL